jgi:hypothetical protein
MLSNGSTIRVFEFKTEEQPVTPGNIEVNLVGKTSANEVRDQIIAAITDANMSVTAQSDGDAKVLIKHADGVVALTESVANAGFTVWGVNFSNDNHVGLKTSFPNYPSKEDPDGRPGGAVGVPPPGGITDEELDVIGNDDPSNPDEDNNPYDEKFYGEQVGPAVQGMIFGQDVPIRSMLNSYGAVGDEFEVRLHFREFARIELGGKWYRCSEEKMWKVHFIFKKSNEKTDNKDYDGHGGIEDKDLWRDNGSIKAQNNDGF